MVFVEEVLAKEIFITSVLAVVTSLDIAMYQVLELSVRLSAAVLVATNSIFKFINVSVPVPILDQPLLTATVPRVTGVAALFLIVLSDATLIKVMFSMVVTAVAAPAIAERMKDLIVLGVE